MIRFSLAVCLVLSCAGAQAITPIEQKMLDRGKPYFPVVNQGIQMGWPDAPMRSFVAAQIQKESLWNPKAELCVPKPTCSRERGVGFGQLTVTPRFNVFEEVKRLHPAIRDWRWEDRHDPLKQVIAMSAKDRGHYRQCLPLMASQLDALSCTAATYNGGFGGFSSDRKLCSNTKGCDPKKWFGHVEHQSMKAKVALAGYGDSFFTINRKYVRALIIEFSPKYVPYLGS